MTNYQLWQLEKYGDILPDYDGITSDQDEMLGGYPEKMEQEKQRADEGIEAEKSYPSDYPEYHQ